MKTHRSAAPSALLQSSTYQETLTTYAEKYVTEKYKADFLNFIAHDNVRKNLTKDHIITFTYMVKFGELETYEMIGHLRQAMERIPQNERAVLESIYIESEEARTVAAKLELSVSHIYRLQKQGIKRIRGMLSRFMRKF